MLSSLASATGNQCKQLTMRLSGLWSMIFKKAPELAAEDLRLAAGALGRITGEIDVEELLGSIFSAFCIGK